MSIKKRINQLEKDFKISFLELNAALYCSRRNLYVHMGLDKAISAYSNFNQIIERINDEYLAEKF